MVSIQDVLGWRPGELADIADAVNRRRRALRDAADTDLPAAEPPDGWAGRDAGEARNAHQELVTSLEDGTSPLSRVVNALDAAATACLKAKRDLEGLLVTARSRGYEVDVVTGTVTDTRVYLDVPDEEDARLGVNQLADQLGEVVAQATAADDALAGALQVARTTVAGVGGDMAPVRRVRKLIHEVDSGTITDPLAALQLPYTAYSKAGRKALAEWVNTRRGTAQVGKVASRRDKSQLAAKPWRLRH